MKKPKINFPADVKIVFDQDTASTIPIKELQAIIDEVVKNHETDQVFTAELVQGLIDYINSVSKELDELVPIAFQNGYVAANYNTGWQDSPVYKRLNGFIKDHTK